MRALRPFVRNSSERGFSLVELMVVVAIIGILSALAVPRFRIFQAKARQAEARNNLSHIYTLEQSYYADNDKYANMAATGYVDGGGNNNVCEDNDLGFVINPCSKARYTYTVTGASTEDFLATAVSGTGANNLVLPGCQNADRFTIDQDKVLKHPAREDDVTRICND